MNSINPYKEGNTLPAFTLSIHPTHFNQTIKFEIDAFFSLFSFLYQKSFNFIAQVFFYFTDWKKNDHLFFFYKNIMIWKGSNVSDKMLKWYKHKTLFFYKFKSKEIQKRISMNYYEEPKTQKRFDSRAFLNFMFL